MASCSLFLLALGDTATTRDGGGWMGRSSVFFLRVGDVGGRRMVGAWCSNGGVVRSTRFRSRLVVGGAWKNSNKLETFVITEEMIE